MQHPHARIVIRARVADALPLLTHLGTVGVEVATPCISEDLDLALQVGVEVFDQGRDATLAGSRTTIIVDPAGEGSALACGP